MNERILRLSASLLARLACLALLVAAPIGWLGTAAQAAEPAAYRMAIVPQFGAQQLLAEWSPVAARLESAAGVRLELQFAPSIPAFEAGFLRGEPDFVFLNPYHAVMARRAQGYIPLVRDRDPLTGILVVSAKGPVQALADLDGRKVAFPSPNAFGASLYIRALLAEQARVRIEPQYVKTHGNVYRLVALGDMPAGGGVNQTFADLPADMRAGLRVLYETPGAASHPLCAHPRVPPATRQKVAAAFLELAGSEPGRALLREIRMPNPVPADYARDYAPLEKLKLDKFVVLER